jgi:hypothetical protein
MSSITVSKVNIPFKDFELTKIYTSAIEELYKTEIYRVISKFKYDVSPQIENKDDIIFAYSDELSVYNLTDKVFAIVNTMKQDDKVFKLKRKLQHRELKRLINWLVRGDFFGEFSNPNEVFIEKEPFNDFISTIFIDAFGDIKDYDLSVVFLDQEEITKSGKKKEGNILPVLELKRKSSSWTSIKSSKDKPKFSKPFFKTDKVYKEKSPYLNKLLLDKKNDVEISGEIIMKAEELPKIVNEYDFSFKHIISSCDDLTPIFDKSNTIDPENTDVSKFLKLKSLEKKISDRILNAFLINGIDLNQNKLLVAINDASRMIAIDLESN